MKGRRHTLTGFRAHPKADERGSAVLVVLTLTIVIAALLLANARMIHQLRQELQRVDKKQQERYSR